MTTTQRSVLPSFEYGLESLQSLGKLHSFDYKYHFALKEMTTGWRAKKELAAGGVILDMGYHAIEILNLFFGTPSNVVKGCISYKYQEMASEKLEDFAQIEFSYEKISGTLSLNRHAAKNEELFRIKGERGTLEINRDEMIRYDTNGTEVDRKCAPLTRKDRFMPCLIVLSNKSITTGVIRPSKETS